jgi:hypothetical protein
VTALYLLQLESLDASVIGPFEEEGEAVGGYFADPYLLHKSRS